MKIGLDYWQVISHYPEYFQELVNAMVAQGHEVHVVSAIGKGRIGTIENEVKGMLTGVHACHEVVFSNPRQSPELKLAKCQELGISVFYDDRDDVCRLLNQHGILAMRVTRKDNRTHDLAAERH
jgi:acid phosphatase class B